jgi:hypothetical protein
MLAHTTRQAEARLRDVELRRVFNLVPLRAWLSAALVASSALLALALAVPGEFWFGFERVATISDVPWPRDTHLSLVGFPDGRIVVARGNDVDVLVRADMAREVPRLVQVHFRTETGSAGTKNMDREGNPTPGVDEYQSYTLRFNSVLEDHWFDVEGGDDDHLRDLWIHVVDSPTLEQLSLSCVFPDYMGRLPAELPVTGAVQLPQGTRVTVNATATKDLVEAVLDSTTALGASPRQVREWTADSANRRTMSFVLDSLDQDTALAFSLRDTDGVGSREPIRLGLSVVVDEPPLVNLRMQGIGTQVTPQAMLPWVGSITDDYGLADATLEFQVNGDSLAWITVPTPAGWFRLALPRVRPLPIVRAGDAEAFVFDAEIDTKLDASQWGLVPGDELTIGAVAHDRRKLPAFPDPNVGRGEVFTLKVVTPEELRIHLETRELRLIPRFKQVIDEITGTRDELARLAPDAARSDGATTEGEPGESRDYRRQRVERVRTHCLKHAQDILDVAASFDDILLELVNNRLPDSTAYANRLRQDIVAPLRDVAEREFDALAEHLASLQDALADPAQEKAARQEALARFSIILAALEAVGEKMLRLETFAEAIDTLRSIIAAHEGLQERTNRQRLEGLEDLEAEGSE